VIPPTLGVLGAAVFVAVVLWSLDRVALGMIRPPYKPLRRRAANLPFPTEWVSIPSGDQKLFGWIARPEIDKNKPVMVMVHGWGSNHGTMTRLAQPLLQMGYPTVLFDVRHHGLSRGAPYVTARHFRDDILATLRVAREEFPERALVLVGHSMGGSTGVLACADGAPVRGLISIGAPADLWEVWAYHLNDKGLPGRWVVRALSPFWRYRAGVPWKDLDPRRCAAQLTIPFLILHGEQDESVPVRHAHLFGEASGLEPRVLPGWGHTDLLESQQLHEIIVEFLDTLPTWAEG
jgi:pimeloyl-ACP methyl ester carboxylesterase